MTHILWIIFYESCFMTHQTFQLMTSVIFPREVRLLHQHRKRIQFCHIRSVPLGRLLINSRISLGTLKILVHMLPIMLRSYKILQDRKVLSYLYRFLKEILELKEFLVLSFQEFKRILRQVLEYSEVPWKSIENTLLMEHHCTYFCSGFK